MSNISVDYDILNQKQTPAFYASSLATRPAFGFPGRIFIDTDTPSSGIYRDTGSAWVQVADPGAGTTGTLQQVTTNGNTTTNSIQVQGIDFSDGAGTGLYNIAIGNQTMGANTTGNNNIAIGYQNLKFNTTGALNVAIGNTALVNNTTGSQNTAVGQLALNLNTTGSQNTALGNATLQNNTTGTGNTAIGHASLVANTTANYNTAIGHQALRINTTGQYNVSVGQDSLANNIIGSNNTAIGQGSLRNNTADNNTAIGFSSLNVNTTGANNVAIGQSSLTANTTGFSNVGIGSRALTANTTGAQNVAIGTDALYINTTGNTNTAIGTAALSLNTTGGGNTAIGVSALNSNTTANYNTAVGGSSLTAITTGTLNTAIGYLSGSAITTGSNNSIIGAYAGTTTLASNIVLSDGAGNVRLYSNSAGLIGINQAVGTPSAQLDIHTTATYGLAVNGTGTSNAYLGFANAGTYKWRIGNTYNAGANTFDIYNLGTSSNAITILSTNNNIGIGVTPTQKLTINGNAAVGGQQAFWFRDDDGFSSNAGRRAWAITANFVSFGMLSIYGASAANSDPLSGTAFVNIASTGNVLIASTTDDTINKLQVNGSIKSTGNLSIYTTGYPLINLGINSSNQFTWVYDNPNTKLLLQYNGNTQFDISSTGIITSLATYNNTTGIAANMQIDSNGFMARSTVSSLRFKENINNWTGGLDIILALKPKTFNYKKEYYNKADIKFLGLIAEEVAEVSPYLVDYENEDRTGQIENVRYANIVVPLIKAIQELKAEIDALKNN